MSNVLTSSALINSIKRRSMIPSDQNTFTDQDFLDMLNEEVQYFAVPRLLRTHEEYLVDFEDVELTSATREYSIPYRAVGNKLRDVALITKDSVTGDVTNYHELSRVSLEELSDFNGSYTVDYTEAFYVQSNKIILLDQVPVASGYLRQFFYLRPNKLVLDAQAGVITGIDRTTGIITLNEFPNTFSTLPKMDFVGNQTPNVIYNYDITPSATDVNTKTVTFATTDIPSDLIVGDYINVAGESIVPQLPTEFHPVIAQRVAIACLEALGDQQGLSIAQSRLQMMEKASTDLIDNRVEGAPQKINNRHGPLKQAVYGSQSNRRRGN